MLNGIVKRVIHYTWRPFIQHYLQKDRHFSYEGIALLVKSGVFHPQFFFSSLMLLDFLKSMAFSGKYLLELGGGAGLLSVYAAKKGAVVTCTDISKRAIDNIIYNAKNNHVQLTVVQSDLFKSLEVKPYELILVNPPFYSKTPQTESEFAWFCGEKLEYFHNLFIGLPAFMNSNSKLYMILSQDARIKEITQMAEENQLVMKQVLKKRTWWEWNFIFEVTRKEVI